LSSINASLDQRLYLSGDDTELFIRFQNHRRQQVLYKIGELTGQFALKTTSPVLSPSDGLISSVQAATINNSYPQRIPTHLKVASCP
jgi:hypothetical protein